MLVELRGIQKKYGKSLILDNIDLSIPEGEALAIIDGNGTGKSTLLKIIAGFISPTVGTLKRKEHIQIGYVPEHFPEGIRFTLEDYLYHLGHIHGLSTKYLRNKIPMLLESFHLDHARHSVVRDFSKGMKQKTGIMQALLTDVHLLILDEPLSGLDPNSQQELEHILLSLKQQGISVLFTCHEKQLLENFADRIVTLASHTIVEDTAVQRSTKQVYIEAIVHETFSAIELQQQSGFIHVIHNSNQNLIQLQIEKNYTNDILQFLLHNKAFITLLQSNF
ncbi:ABC transporter ATP-binding protein [Bacillus cereus]|uniref:ABC transporter ATP-binding protein n=1 Tax=Bacillus cereus TaxID=1396 RepID=UPI000BF3CCD7|nr:ABC transporter ATP-binding protein [Bacillus cereus]PER08747.1 ABC transporter ATP-binding protein [Bacillus cereus]